MDRTIDVLRLRAQPNAFSSMTAVNGTWMQTWSFHASFLNEALSPSPPFSMHLNMIGVMSAGTRKRWRYSPLPLQLRGHEHGQLQERRPPQPRQLERAQQQIDNPAARIEGEAAGCGGAGLGLAICREIMGRLGGDITYLPGQEGAAFRVVLPVREGATVQAAQ